MGKRVDGRVAIVTGGGGGIGAATVAKLVEEGARVLVADMRMEAAEEVAARFGDAASACRFDATDSASVEAMVQTAVERYGRLDILHNNAAAAGAATAGKDTTVADIDFDTWDLVMETNARGYAAGCKYAIPHMIAAGGGSIIQTTSAAGMSGDVVRTAYGTSKAAIIGLTLYVATQYGRQGVRCNAIAPGAILTAAMRKSVPRLAEVVGRHALVSRLGEPEDVANLACFLASDEAAFITGQVIACDGGHLSHQPHYADLLAMEGSGF